MAAPDWPTVLTSAGVASFVSSLFVFWNGKLARDHEKDRWKMEEERWKAEPFREARFRYLLALHETLTDALFGYSTNLAGPANREEWSEQYFGRINRLHEAGVRAQLFLPDPARQALQQAIAAYREAAEDVLAAIGNPGAPPPEIIFSDFAERYTELNRHLQEVLSPGPLFPAAPGKR